ncbi:MAG: tetratricopeptide repeat protein [Thermoplasmata archaeon]
MKEGRALASLGRFEDSIGSFNEARRIAPRDTATLKYLGMALLKLNRVAEALRSFDEAIQLGSNDKDMWKSRAKAFEAIGNKEEAANSYMKALEVDQKDQAAWYRLGLLHLEIGRHSDANACFDRALDIDSSNPKIWMSKGFAMEKQGLFEEAVSSYDRAIGLDSNDKEAWKSKGQVLLQLGRPEQSLRCFDHALSIDPYFEAAAEGRKQSEDDIRKNKIEDYSRAVLEFEYTHGRPVTKEEAFKVCGIPYAFLGDVLDFLSGKADLTLTGMPKDEFDRCERMSREVLVNAMEKRDLAAHGLRLCDITVNFPDLKIATAKKILSYIQAVEEHEFSTKSTDPQTEELLRQALELPNDQKNVLGLIRNLGIGAYWARQLVTILQTFQGAGFETPSVALKSIVSEGYGRYSPYDERAARRAMPPMEEREEMRERPRRAGIPEELEREEHPEERRPREPRRYGREVEALRERPWEREREERPRREARPAPKEIPSDLVGRRCLFHGGIAITRCAKCKAVLCRECIRGSERCPRCNTPLGAPVEPGEGRRPRREEIEGEPEEGEIEEERPRRRGREGQRSVRKKGESEDDLTRLLE